MSENVDILSHSRVAQHTFVQKEKARPSRPAVGATSFYVETSSSRVNMSSTSSSQRHKSLVISTDAPEVQPAIFFVPDAYSGDPSDILLLCLYAGHVFRQVWDGKVK